MSRFLASGFLAGKLAKATIEWKEAALCCTCLPDGRRQPPSLIGKVRDIPYTPLYKKGEAVKLQKVRAEPPLPKT